MSDSAPVASRLSAWLGISAAVLLIDQATKYWVVSVFELYDRVQVLPFFAWVRWHNTGAAFSFLADGGGWQRWFFVALAVGFSTWLIWELVRLARSPAARWAGAQALAFSLILGGALGNMIDRALHGYVVDFILVHYDTHYFPAFNIADSALFCGAVLWIILMFLEGRQASNADNTSN